MRRRDVLTGVCSGLLATGRSTGHPSSPTSSYAETPTVGYAPIASIPLPRAAEAVVGSDGTTVFVAVHDGVDVVDISDPSAPIVISRLRDILDARDDGPLRDIQDVAVDGDRLLVVGRAHRRADALDAAVLYDVAEPAAPELVAAVETEFPIHNADLDGTTAYLTANDRDANPLVVVAMPAGTERGRWSPLDVDTAWVDVDHRLRAIHDVWVRDGRAYCSYWDAGTWILDVRDPAAPTAVTRVGGPSPGTLAGLDGPGVRRAATGRPGNHHSAAASPDGATLAVGKESWAVAGEGGPSGIDLYDLRDATTRVATIEPIVPEDPSRDGVWTTAHNFDFQAGYLFSAWYQGGIRVHDVHDPSAPVEVAAWRDPDRARLWTAQRARDAVIASSMGTSDAAAGLLVFPLPAGIASTGGSVIRPGGGVAATVAGLAAAAWLANRRRRRG